MVVLFLSTHTLTYDKMEAVVLVILEQSSSTFDLRRLVYIRVHRGREFTVRVLLILCIFMRLHPITSALLFNRIDAR